jgi:hypothetical protein
MIITNFGDAKVWIWDHLAFGDNAPHQNPGGLGTATTPGIKTIGRATSNLKPGNF